MFKVGAIVESHKNGQALGALGTVTEVNDKEIIVVPNDPIAVLLGYEASYTLDGVGVSEPEFSIKEVEG